MKLIKHNFFLVLIFVFTIPKIFATDLTPQEIYEKVNNSVVILYSYDFDKNPLKQGSGVVINDSGYIMTNYHIFSECENIVVYHNEENLGVADIINADMDKDILIIKIENENLKTIKIGNSDDCKVGEKIYAIGSPLGYENTISDGIISGIRNNDFGGKLIQITASISGGSSGGAVVNSNGELIGISTFQEKEGQNINFAIPINEITEFKNSFSYEKHHLEGNKIFLKGYNAYTTKKYEDAVYYYSGYLKIFPESDAVLYNRGLALFKLERYKESIRDFNKAIELGDNSASIFYSRGKDYQGLGEYDLALKDFNYAITLYPNSPESLNKRGECYLEMGDYQNAIKDFSYAINLDDSYSLYYYNRGVAYEYSKNKINALKDYSHAIELFSTYFDAYYSRAALYNDLNQFDNSIGDFEKCIELIPDYKYPYNNIGWVYFNKGDYSNAITFLEKCYQIDNTDWDAVLGMAAAYFKKGNNSKAEKYLKVSVSIEPKLKKGMEGLSILEKEGYTYKKAQKKTIEEMFDEFN